MYQGIKVVAQLLGSMTAWVVGRRLLSRPRVNRAEQGTGQGTGQGAAYDVALDRSMRVEAVEARRMCRRVPMSPIAATSPGVAAVLKRLRETHGLGDALLAGVEIGQDEVFDRFGRQHRFLEHGILQQLLCRDEVRHVAAELSIPRRIPQKQFGKFSVPADGLGPMSAFLLEGELAVRLFEGGAYGARPMILGVAARRMAMEFCEELFGFRYEEMEIFQSHDAWTPWFKDVAWDWTVVLIDRQKRILWLLALTDED